MKSITDLLDDSKASTKDWYVYAKGIYDSVAFTDGTIQKENGKHTQRVRRLILRIMGLGASD